MDNQMKLSPQLVLGLCAIGFGIMFTLDNLDLLHAGSVWRFWPVVLIVVGVVQILWAGGATGLITGAIVGGIGTLWLLDNLGYIRFSLWDYWPLLLVFIGGSLVWHALQRDRGIAGSSADVVNGFALMSGVVRTCNSQRFRGGEFTAIMGGCEVDLRQASIQDGDAVIQVLAFWGGIELKVPEDWSVRSSVIPLLGGFEDKTRPPLNGGAKTLFIRGFAVMGGVEAHN
jgi:hypothetical protein